MQNKSPEQVLEFYHAEYIRMSREVGETYLSGDTTIRFFKSECERLAGIIEARLVKKTYRTPIMKCYGNIHDITAGHGTRGSRDSQSGAKFADTMP